MGAGRIGDIAARADRRRARARHAGRRGAQRHACPTSTRCGPRSRRSRDAGVRVAERDRRRRGRRRSTSRGSSAGRCSGARSWSPVRASRRASCARGSRRSAPRCSSCRRSRSSRSTSRCPTSHRYAWLVFTSANGVDAFFDRGLAPAGLDARALAGLRVAAIGPGTAGALARTRRASPTSCPSASSPSRCSTRSPHPAHAGARVLWSRAPSRRATCCPRASVRAATTSTCSRCTARCRRRPTPATLERVRAGEVDAITFTSSSTVTNFCDLRRRRCPIRSRWSSRSVPSPRDTARDRGLRVDAEADPHTIDGARRRVLVACGSRSEPAQRPVRYAFAVVPFPEQPHAAAAPHAGAAPAGRRARAVGRRPRGAAVREGGHRRARAGRVDARRGAAHPGEPAQGGARARRPRRARGDPLRHPGAQGRARLAAPTRPTASCRSRCATCATRSATTLVLDGRRLPRRVHRPRPLRVLTPDGEVDNDATLERYATIAVAQADAGADVIAPSGMMDGQVGAIRAALDAAGHHDTAILAYAAKYASALYGPFRDAAECAPQFGDRRATRWTPPTRARRSTRSRSTSTRAPTW